MRCAWSKRCDEKPTEQMQMLWYCLEHASEAHRNRMGLISAMNARLSGLRKHIGEVKRAAPTPRVEVVKTLEPIRETDIEEPEEEKLFV